MFRVSLSFFVVAGVALVGPGVGRCAPPSEAQVTREYLAQVREGTSRLARSLENLQQSIVEDLGGEKERTLYRKADAALGALDQFRGAVKDSATSKRLFEQFGPVDGKVRALLSAVAALGADARALHREATRVSAAEDELYYSLSSGDSSTGRLQNVLKRQARRLLVSARELERTAQYALARSSAQPAPVAFHRLVEDAEKFQRVVEAGASLEEVRKDFLDLSGDWQKVAQVLKAAKPGENLYLIRTAARLDRMHARLHELLGIKGERPGLILRT